MKKRLLLVVGALLIMCAIAYAITNITYVANWNLDTKKNGMSRVDIPATTFINATQDTTQFDFDSYTDIVMYSVSTTAGYHTDTDAQDTVLNYILKLQQSLDGSNWITTESTIIETSESTYTLTPLTPVRSPYVRIIRYEGTMGTHDTGTVRNYFLLIQ